MHVNRLVKESNCLLRVLTQLFIRAAAVLQQAKMQMEERVLQGLQVEWKVLLSAVRGIPATYRMTKKHTPRHASPYVERALVPLQALRAAAAGLSPRTTRRLLLRAAADAMATYACEVQQLLQTEEQKDVSLLRLQRGSSNSSASSLQSHAASADFFKIKMQLLLDVRAMMSALLELLHPLDVETCQQQQGCKTLQDIILSLAEATAERAVSTADN